MSTKTIKLSLKISTILSILALSIALGTILINRNRNEDLAASFSYEDYVVFTVDGEPVTMREYNHSIAHVRGRVVSSFIAQGADFGCASFWHTQVNGAAPFEVLHQQATERAIRIKITNIQARERGLIDNISYGNLMAELVQENQRREETVAAAGVIFGPQAYSESLFFDIQSADIEEALRRDLAPELSSTEEELMEFYLAEWQETPSEAGWILIDKLYVPFMPTGVLFEREALELMEEVQQMVLDGAEFEGIAEEFRHVQFQEQFLALRRGDGSLERRASIEIARDQDVGYLSDIYRDQDSWAILLITARNEREFLSFDDLWVVMQRTLAEWKFIDFIDELVAEAEIVINTEVVELINSMIEGSPIL